MLIRSTPTIARMPPPSIPGGFGHGMHTPRRGGNYGVVQRGLGRGRLLTPYRPVVPGAYGAGMWTRAAYGCQGQVPTVLRVTSLADSGPGSLRDALTQTGPRVIVFDTSGTIDMSATGDCYITAPFCTVAGQTAPSPGITIKGAGIYASANDMLIQHLRIRPGDGYGPYGAPIPPTQDHDALGIYSPTVNPFNVVIDHCSVSWAGGKNLNIVPGGPPGNCTVWRCLSSEALYRPVNTISSYYGPPDDAPSSLCCLVGGVGDNYGLGSFSVIGCLFGHCSDRNCEIHENTILEFLNNVVYDWGGDANNYQWGTFLYHSGNGLGPYFASVVGNVYIGGNGNLALSPAHPVTPLYAVGAYNAISGEEAYVFDNTIDSTVTTVNPFYFNAADPRVGSPPVPLTGTPIASSGVRSAVSGWVGARPSDRDSVDTRIVADVAGYTGSIIASQSAVGGWPSLAVNTGSFVIPPNPHAVNPSTGYTYLEDALHAAATAVGA